MSDLFCLHTHVQSASNRLSLPPSLVRPGWFGCSVCAVRIKPGHTSGRRHCASLINMQLQKGRLFSAAVSLAITSQDYKVNEKNLFSKRFFECSGSQHHRRVINQFIRVNSPGNQPKNAFVSVIQSFLPSCSLVLSSCGDTSSIFSLPLEFYTHKKPRPSGPHKPNHWQFRMNTKECK